MLKHQETSLKPKAQRLGSRANAKATPQYCSIKPLELHEYVVFEQQLRLESLGSGHFISQATPIEGGGRGDVLDLNKGTL